MCCPGLPESFVGPTLVIVTQIKVLPLAPSCVTVEKAAIFKKKKLPAATNTVVLSKILWLLSTKSGGLRRKMAVDCYLYFCKVHNQTSEEGMWCTDA